MRKNKLYRTEVSDKSNVFYTKEMLDSNLLLVERTAEWSSEKQGYAKTYVIVHNDDDNSTICVIQDCLSQSYYSYYGHVIARSVSEHFNECDTVQDFIDELRDISTIYDSESIPIDDEAEKIEEIRDTLLSFFDTLYSIIGKQ